MASSVVYQRKRALIIGINNYRRDPLKYCINDATDLATTLQRIHFHVSLVLDCSLHEFKQTVNTFVDIIEYDDLVLFYFAGHGNQTEDDNYLLPSDYNYIYQGNERDYISRNAVSEKYIMQNIDDKKCRIIIYLYDCCRNVVRTRSTSGKQGLSTMHAPSQTLVVQ